MSYLREIKKENKPTTNWLEDTAVPCINRALAIVDLMRFYEEHEDEVLPDTVENACWAVKQELLAVRDALNQHYEYWKKNVPKVPT